MLEIGFEPVAEMASQFGRGQQQRISRGTGEQAIGGALLSVWGFSFRRVARESPVEVLGDVYDGPCLPLPSRNQDTFLALIFWTLRVQWLNRNSLALLPRSGIIGVSSPRKSAPMPSDPQAESEWQTRKRRIDTRLEAMGWRIVPFDPGRPLTDYPQNAITEFETANGPADYALCVDGSSARHRRGQEAHPRAAERAGPGRAVLQGHHRTARSTSAASACRSSTRPTAR